MNFSVFTVLFSDKTAVLYIVEKSNNCPNMFFFLMGNNVLNFIFFLIFFIGGSYLCVWICQNSCLLPSNGYIAKFVFLYVLDAILFIFSAFKNSSCNEKLTFEVKGSEKINLLGKYLQKLFYIGIYYRYNEFKCIRLSLADELTRLSREH